MSQTPRINLRPTVVPGPKAPPFPPRLVIPPDARVSRFDVASENPTNWRRSADGTYLPVP
jgi:hypothetical protein